MSKNSNKMKKEVLKTVILEQKELFFKKKYISRKNINLLNNDNNVVIVSGIRRCGKSSLLNIILRENKETDYYINFDDERLMHFSIDDFQLLHEVFIELFGEQKTFYFDEIQLIDKWERFIRRLHDYDNKIYITGSNASMLSKELGTHLTGRHIQLELFPFSFEEFLDFKKLNITKTSIYTTQGKALLKKEYLNFVKYGGFPEYVKNKNTQYLKTLYQNILYRDVLVRNNLSSETEFRELTYFITGNIAKLFSYNSLSKVINVKHTQTVKRYLKFLQDSYLIFLVNKYNFSIKKQIQNPKKIYFIDAALASSISFSFSENKGRILENIVFLELKRRGLEIYYHKNKYECDFVIHKRMEIVEAIQVSISLFETKTREREIRGLFEAMENYNLQTGIIITEDEEETIHYENKKIEIKPIYKWLLKIEES